ncbi:MAG: hypothetical protein Q7V57_11255 [Actinomycetota bacterium]|nr:hypothetical protein [Actinomycetota bacterium]
MGARSAPVALAAGALVTSVGALAGVSFRETAGAAATVKLYDNASAASGKLLGTFGLAALGSIDTEYVNGRQITNGVYAVITGTVEGSIFI